MKISYLKYIPFLALLISTNSQAEIGKCIGMDNSGDTIKVIMDFSTDILIVNGYTYKLEAQTKDKRGVATIDFINTNGAYVYDEIWVSQNGDYYLNQLNAVTNEILTSISLSCHNESN